MSEKTESNATEALRRVRLVMESLDRQEVGDEPLPPEKRAWSAGFVASSHVAAQYLRGILEDSDPSWGDRHYEPHTGAELIAAERRRQVEQEGWTLEHDGGAEREHACLVGCTGGACETCPCCSAGWCVFGLDGLPSEPDDLSMWLDVAADHNPVVAAVRAVLDLAMSDNENRALSRSTVVATVRAALAGGTS